jgi:hypothetical protein
VYSQVADATSVVASSPGSSKSRAPSSPQQNRSSNKKTNSTDRNKYFGAASSPFSEIQHDDAVPSVSPLNRAFKEFNFGNAEEDTNISLSDEYDSTFHHHDDRVSINLSESNINRLYHFVNPKVLTYNGERYAICNLKVPPVYCTGNNIEVEVSENGLQAFIYFTEPKLVHSSISLLGFKPRDRDYNIVHAAVMEAVAEKKGHAEGKVKRKLVLDLPFVSEPKTSPDLLGAETGQRSDIIGITSNPDVASCTGNCVFVFKEIGLGFNSSKKAAVHFFETVDGMSSSARMKEGMSVDRKPSSSRKRSVDIGESSHEDQDDNAGGGSIVRTNKWHCGEDEAANETMNDSNKV